MCYTVHETLIIIHLLAVIHIRPIVKLCVIGEHKPFAAGPDDTTRNTGNVRKWLSRSRVKVRYAHFYVTNRTK